MSTRRMFDQLKPLNQHRFKACETIGVVSALLCPVEKHNAGASEWSAEVDLAEHRSEQREVGLEHNDQARWPHAIADSRDVVTDTEAEHRGGGTLLVVDEIGEGFSLFARRMP